MGYYDNIAVCKTERTVRAMENKRACHKKLC